MKEFFKKFLFKKSCILICVIYGCFLLVTLTTLGFANHALNGITVDYESSNVPSGYESQASGAQESTQYRYYLDISPSMLGYSSAEGRMAAVAQTMLTLNQERGNAFDYYTCGNIISHVASSDFFDFMRSGERMATYYKNAFENGTFSEMNQSFDLSRIFTDQYSDNQSFNGDDSMVNVIITDMNFLKNQSELEYHTALLNRFSEQLSLNIADSNICVYRIRSSHTGPLTDEYNPNEAQLTNRDDSFFIIVMAKNNRNFSQYIAHFEQLFEDNGISLAENHKLQNNPVETDQSIVLWDDSGTLLNIVQNETQRTGLHWDNQYFRNLPDNAIGVRAAYNNDEPFASIRLPVTSLSLSGYDQTAGDTELAADSAGEISANIEIYQYTLAGGWRKHTDFSPVAANSAYLRNNGGTWYLYFNMELNKNLLPSGWLHACLLIDVRFELVRPRYSVPAWVDAIHADGLPEGTDFSAKIGLRGFFEQINAVKEGAYENSANAGQGYLGNLFVLVNC